MNTHTSMYTHAIAAAALFIGAATVANAASYRIDEITKAETPGMAYTINGGNQYLNDRGQVTGVSLKYSDDKVYNSGPRGFVWADGKMQALGTLGNDALGYGSSNPAAINDKGQVAGSSTYFVKAIDQGPRAFSWLDGSLLQLKQTDKGFVSGNAVAINTSGAVAGSGQYYDGGIDKGSRALLWTDRATLNLGTLGTDSSGSGGSAATALNNNNQAVGYSDYFDSNGNWSCVHAFLWAGGRIQDLGTLGTDPGGFACSVANAVNANSQVVGYSDYYDSNGNWLCVHAVLWAGGRIQDLGTLGTDLGGFGCSAPIAINANNQVVGYSDYYDTAGNWSGQHAFVWASGALNDLGMLGVDESGFSFSIPYAVNDAGQVVGYSTYSENGVAKGNRAFLYEAGVMVDLNTLLPPGSGLLLENALAVNNRGQITAFATRTEGSSSDHVYVLLTP